MTEDNATQGWELCHYGIRAPDGTEFFTLSLEGRQKLANRLNTALQRPSREAELVEALRNVIDGLGDGHMGHCKNDGWMNPGFRPKEWPVCPLCIAKALISPLG